MISRANNFDLIRLFAALQVAVYHTMEHLEYQYVGWGVKFPFPGVICFFVISGFLITSSWDRNPSFTKYIKNRFLRIIPALWTAFFILVIVLACFGYINSATIKRPQFWFYCVGQLTLFQFYTPDFLRTFGVGCPNGSLWTIPVEFVFYLILPLLIYYTRQCKNIGLIIVSALSITINVLISKFGDGGIIFKLIGCSVFPWL